MKRKVSAGILLYRVRDDTVQVFLVHPGGPYWARKDEGAWSIPKGEVAPGADLLATAFAEFAEETGYRLIGQPAPLRPLKQAGGKLVHAWMLQGDVDAAAIRSNSFDLVWPPGSGKTRQFPEVDRAAWFDLAAARQKLLEGQRGFLDELEARLARSAALPGRERG
ncbi:MAG TPA: NUDIX domain-containing protein [Casimicrobiaceae bacterium]|jgi:predicted NUDIX family NTP pyrophosphohydrolase